MKKCITPEENQKNKEPAREASSLWKASKLTPTREGGPRQPTAFLYIFPAGWKKFFTHENSKKNSRSRESGFGHSKA